MNTCSVSLLLVYLHTRVFGLFIFLYKIVFRHFANLFWIGLPSGLDVKENVLCHVNYNSIIWSSYTTGPIHRLGAIRNRFLRIMSIKRNIQRLPHTSHEPLLLCFNIDTLQARRVKHDICFTYKL